MSVGPSPFTIPPRLHSHIATGECVLFLGAGVSLDAGAPTAQDMANEMLSHFLSMEPGAYGLADAAALIDAEDGRRRLNDWVVRRLKDLIPSEAIRELPKYRWRAIYTTNYDDLVETAYREATDPAQVVRPFYSDKDSLSSLQDNEVPLYKLHGCVTRANSDDGRLVITQDDFAVVEQSRRRLFNRLVDHVADQPVLYVGFGRADPDFARILAQVERAVGAVTGLSRSYALHPGHNEAESKRAEMKKVSLLDAGAQQFFSSLAAELGPESEMETPTAISSLLQARRKGITGDALAAIAADLEIVDDELNESSTDADAFYRGGPPSWADIKADVDATRDVTDSVLEAALVDPETDQGANRLVLLHSEAGSGKTTLLRRIAVELATTWDRVVLSLLPFGALDFFSFEQFAAQAGERVYIAIDDVLRVAPELRVFMASARRARSPVTILAAARTNEWKESSEGQMLAASVEFELDALSSKEIEGVIERLDVHGALGFLKDASPQARHEAFSTRADKQLLVALREATEGKAFDDIVVDEFERIPTEDAKRAYLFIAALHRFGLFTRAAVLHRALKIPLTELGQRVFAPAAKIIVAQELGLHRDPYYRTRHPLIAEIVFDRRVPSEAERLAFYVSLVRELDLGFASDADTYRRLSRSLNKTLLRDFSAVANKRALMNEIQDVDPSDGFVAQHAAMMELSFGDLAKAARYIATAKVLRPDDIAVRDTEGRIVLATVPLETTPARKLAKLTEAEQIFSRNIAQRPYEPFGYRGLAETYWTRHKVESSPAEQGRYIGRAYEVLADGLDNSINTSMLMQYRAKLEEAEGRSEDALAVLDVALSDRPDDVPMRVMASRIAERTGSVQDAIRMLREGVAAAPDAWELHYRLAVLLAEDDEDAHRAEIDRHFSNAMLAPSRRYRPRLTYAAWLFASGDYDRAQNQFDRFGAIEVPASERYEARRFVFGTVGKRQTGRITRLAYESGHVEFDGGATRIFFRTQEIARAMNLRVGSELSYDLRFNLLGPVARNLGLAE